MAEIIEFTGPTTLDIDPSKILIAASEQNLSSVVIIGSMRDGSAYYATSSGDIGFNLIMVEVFKRSLIDEAVQQS